MMEDLMGVMVIPVATTAKGRIIRSVHDSSPKDNVSHLQRSVHERDLGFALQHQTQFPDIRALRQIEHQ